MQVLAEISTGRCLTEAREMGTYLRSCVRRATDGSPVWLKPPRPDRGETQPKALGPHLYAGCVGVALFLGGARSTCWTKTSGSTFRGALWRCCGAAIRVGRRLPGVRCSALKIGGLIGLGSLIYSFVRVGIWLGDPTLVEEACGLATLITPERIAADNSLDLLFGTAGALVGLLVLDREAGPAARGRVKPLERALACGEHLLRHRSAEAGPRGWPYQGGLPLTGFAHGAAGIAYALALLARRTGARNSARRRLRDWPSRGSSIRPRLGTGRPPSLLKSPA